MDGLISDVFSWDAGEASGNAGGWVECPYDDEVVIEWVWDTLTGTKNNSATGPDGVAYKLIKAIRDTKQWTEVLGEIVATLRGGAYQIGRETYGCY